MPKTPRAATAGAGGGGGHPFRDVDVRQPVPDDDPLFADPDRLRLLNVAMSVWGQQTTGLPIDFQFQPMAEWKVEVEKAEAAGKHRNPLGTRWQREARP